MKRYWPRYDRVGLGNEIPPLDYLEWYIPKLIEQREHNLSHSGMQYDWDIDEIIDSSVKELTNPIMDSTQDPRNILSEIYDVPIQNLLLCHGATQAINIAIIAAKTRYPNIGKVTIAAESPTYAPMPQSSLILDCNVRRVDRLEPKSGFGPWEIDREAWRQELSESQILMLSPILNPSGWNLSISDRDWIVDYCINNNITIISDEVYLDAYKDSPDYMPFYKLHSSFISINSLTKVYSMGQLRFGWLMGDDEFIEQAKRIFMTFSGIMGSPSVRIGTEILKHLSVVDSAIQDYREKNLPYLREMFQRLAIPWNEPPLGVFSCFKLPLGIDAVTFVDEECKEHDVLAVPCSMFQEDLNNWLRIAWSIEPKKFKRACDALEKSLKTAMSKKQVNKSN